MKMIRVTILEGKMEDILLLKVILIMTYIKNF